LSVQNQFINQFIELMMSFRGFHCKCLLMTNNRTGLRFSSASSLPTASNATATEARTEGANAKPSTMTWKQLAKDLIPGQTPLQKGLFASLLGAAYYGGVHTGYYVPTDDTVSLASFVVLLRMAYLKFGRPLSDYLDAEIAQEERQWYAIHRRDHDKYSAQLTHLQSFLDYPTTVSAIFDMQAASVVMEREVARLQHRLMTRSTILQQAKDLVKREQERLLEEARQYRLNLQAELQLLLQDPAVQQRILHKALKDLQTQPLVSLQSSPTA
jgi:hypothetical protein